MKKYAFQKEAYRCGKPPFEIWTLAVFIYMKNMHNMYNMQKYASHYLACVAQLGLKCGSGHIWSRCSSQINSFFVWECPTLCPSYIWTASVMIIRKGFRKHLVISIAFYAHSLSIGSLGYTHLNLKQSHWTNSDAMWFMWTCEVTILLIGFENQHIKSKIWVA